MRLFFILILIPLNSYKQAESFQLATTKYAGTFAYEKGKSGASGTIQIYPESDSTVLFYLDINRGAPAYNMGALYDRIKIGKGHGTYESRDERCQFKMQFSTDRLTVATIKEFYNCGFGQGVLVDGIYQRTSKKIPDYFVNLEGIKYFFKSTAPEEYNKE